MIALLKGNIAYKELNSLVCEVNGIGYEVAMADKDLDSLTVNQEVTLYTYHHIREQSQELFGFLELGGKELFQKLISVNGVGPKVGLAILAIGGAGDIAKAVANGDVAYISQAKGVGKKVAERLCVDLKDKIGVIADDSSISVSTVSIVKDDAIDALTALGYSQSQAEQALAGVDQSLSVEDKIKQALKGI